MSRILALIVLWVGLVSAGSPLIACATASAGDCCPAGAPSGCTDGYQQPDVAATVCCVTSSASSTMVSAERSGSPDPLAVISAFVSVPKGESSSVIDTTLVRSAPTDRSLTYLHTGRLRL